MGWCLQVVESGGKNIEIAVMTHKDGLRELEEAEIDEYVAEIEAEKAAAEAAKKGAPKETWPDNHNSAKHNLS